MKFTTNALCLLAITPVFSQKFAANAHPLRKASPRNNIANDNVGRAMSECEDLDVVDWPEGSLGWFDMGGCDLVIGLYNMIGDDWGSCDDEVVDNVNLQNLVATPGVTSTIRDFCCASCAMQTQQPTGAPTLAPTNCYGPHCGDVYYGGGTGSTADVAKAEVAETEAEEGGRTGEMRNLEDVFQPATKDELQDAVHQAASGTWSGQDIALWDVSLVTDFSWLFSGSSSGSCGEYCAAMKAFNPDLSSWETGQVTTMEFTFL